MVAVDHATVSRWIGAFAADAGNAPPPDSRQHFSTWAFPTADTDAGAQSYFGAMPPQERARDMWLNCMSQREIAELLGVDQSTVSRWIDAFAADAGNASSPDSRQRNAQTADFSRSMPDFSRSMPVFGCQHAVFGMQRVRCRRTTTGAGRGSRAMNTTRRITVMHPAVAQPLNGGSPPRRRRSPPFVRQASDAPPPD